MPAELTFSCQYCGPGQQVGPHVTHDPTTADEATWRQYWKDRATNNRDIECAMCGAQYDLEDDGVAAGSGGGLQKKNVSRPKITSIDPTSGPEAGGTTISISGDALEVGTLAVKFDGVNATNMQNRTANSVDVDAPAGTGTVDVTVENEHGQRKDGSSVLSGGYTYT